MIYHHQFRVNDALARVAEFHSRSASMAEITPPPIIARVHNAPAVLNEITLKIRLHPIWGLVGVGMRLGLPILFAYRVWKTKRILR